MSKESGSPTWQDAYVAHGRGDLIGAYEMVPPFKEMRDGRRETLRPIGAVFWRRFGDTRMQFEVVAYFLTDRLPAKPEEREKWFAQSDLRVTPARAVF